MFTLFLKPQYSEVDNCSTVNNNNGKLSGFLFSLKKSVIHCFSKTITVTLMFKLSHWIAM